MRRAAIELGRTEANPDELITGFQRLLQKQSTAMTVTLLFDNGSFYVGGDLKFAKERPAFIGLRDIGWATPESVQRRRSTTPLEDIREFMAQYSLGLVLTAPRRSASPSLIVAFGIKANEWPFTYPEIERLHNVTELIDNIITRSRLSAEAALKAKVEHLSIMSRGLAHDLKNLITPISSYLVHTDDRHAPGSVEHEVHAAARRSVRIMTDYIREALFFANELTAKFERVELRSIVDSAVDIARQRAERRGVTIAMSVDESLTLVVDAVLLQRLFVNLLANAVDASSVGSNVTLRASAGSPDRVQVEVIDEGCGIPMDVFSRIFEPYFTTKEFGEEVRGFGLGLTICQKIVNLHAGVIHVRSEIDVGTTITVELPVVPPTAMSSSGNSAGGSEAAHAAGGHSRTHPGTTHVDSAAPDRR
jgi:signal transduction histidine kinase